MSTPYVAMGMPSEDGIPSDGESSAAEAMVGAPVSPTLPMPTASLPEATGPAGNPAPAEQPELHTFMLNLNVPRNFPNRGGREIARIYLESIGPGINFTMGIPLKGGSEIKGAAVARRADMEQFGRSILARGIGRMRAVTMEDQDNAKQANERKRLASARLADAVGFAKQLHDARPSGGKAAKCRRQLDRLGEVLLMGSREAARHVREIHSDHEDDD